MSKFNKKAKAEGPKIYRVRDIFELFKNGEATIRIISKRFQRETYDWDMSVYWDRSAKKYNVDALPPILDRIVRKVETLETVGVATIKVYI